MRLPRHAFRWCAGSTRARAADLGVSKLRPWDLEVDPHQRPALRPFKEDEVALFIAKRARFWSDCRRRWPAISISLRAHDNLDLDSRKGKQPGGYQISLEQSRQPFIFMNAAGLQRDVETLLHEAGHAFHSLAACRTEPLVFFRSAPMEFCEVASMSMELLGAEHFEVFYDPADTARAQRKLFEGIIRFFPWMATIDSFQHWIYTHPGHSRTERTARVASNRRIGSIRTSIGAGMKPHGSRSGIDSFIFFTHRSITSNMASRNSGALQLWMKSKHDPRGALNHYRAALALGGTRPLPELFAAAGIVFDFSEKTLAPLMDALQDELAHLPD